MCPRLPVEDVAVDDSMNPSIVSLHLKQSKIDQVRQGVKVVMGRTKDEICPVATLLCYLSLRGNSSGPLFHWKDGIPLTRTHFVVKVHWALTRAHLPAKGHSFCIGAATTAMARAGFKARRARQ